MYSGLTPVKLTAEFGPRSLLLFIFQVPQKCVKCFTEQIVDMTQAWERSQSKYRHNMAHDKDKQRGGRKDKVTNKIVWLLRVKVHILRVCF